jgi:predicted O-methyltransferase YrrM
VHPPFAYNFIKQVFFGKAIENSETIESIRNKMLLDKSMVRVMDHGAGSRIKMKENRRICDLARNTSVSPRYGQVLARLVQLMQPGTIIELGTGTGMASLYMSLGYPDAKIFTCEGSGDIAAIARDNFVRAGIFDIDLSVEKFDTFLPVILEGLNEDIFLFIDGDHRENSLKKYFSYILASNNSRGVLVIDDINWSQGMRRAWESLRTHPLISLSVETFRMGFIIFGMEIQRDHFIVKY